MQYSEFLEQRRHSADGHGFEPLWMPDKLYPFQTHLTEWAIRQGRGAIYAACGLGKSPIQLAWAENVVRKTNERVLILCPLAVAEQTCREGEKFDVEAKRSKEGELPGKIVVTNYERLHYFNASDFGAVVCDESSILKNFDGKTKADVTAFMKKIQYRLLCTATAAPNDYMELGTSSEAIGELGFMDMLNRFFKKCDKTESRREELSADKYRFRGHAEREFWRWVCSWARAVRKPSDLGYDDGPFVLPELITRQHMVSAREKDPEWLFDMPAITLEEQRRERRRTIAERCEMVCELIGDTKDQCVCWCHLNDEGDVLEKMIPGAVQVAGKDPDDKKEELFTAFAAGDVRVMVTKPKIAGFGLNWQHCHRQTFFPSHSFEQWYQAIRRSWRFGQKHPVTVDVITSEGESRVLENMNRKAAAADKMFARLVELMGNELRIECGNEEAKQEEMPSWL